MARKWTLKIVMILTGTLFSAHTQASPRFTGGICSSQGSWMQSALQQAETISSAIQALRSDPNCTALIAAVESSPRIDANLRTAANGDEVTSYANFSRELSAIADFMKPDRLQTGVAASQFRQLAFNVVFNKSFDAIQSIHEQPDLQNLSAVQRLALQSAGLRLRSFIERSQQVAEMAMATTTNIVKALPQSQLCFHNRPSEAAAIFSSVVSVSASLLSGGKVNGVGEFIGGLMTFSREMDYVRNLAPMERERFQASVSCLVESTSEAYCALQDAEDALDFIRGNAGSRRTEAIEQAVTNSESDPVASPLGGMIVLMRDVPVITNWMQRVLFGIDPRVGAEATMKNNNWTSFLNFIMSVNTLQANFRDKQQLYQSNSATRDRMAKLSSVQEIHAQIISDLQGGGGRPMRGNDTINFFMRTMNEDQLMFFLLGVDQIPPEYLNNPSPDKWAQNWNRWSQEGLNGFSDPDQLLETVRIRLWRVMDLAKVEANAFFANRMIADPQNLVTEAMRGPGITAYEGFDNLKKYFTNLIAKLERSIARGPTRENTAIRIRQIRSQLPLLRDTVRRLTSVIQAMDSIGDIPADANETQMAEANQRVMDIAYNIGNMLISRDSFFSTRMQTALQADLSDTLYTNRNVTERQSQLLFAIGADIVSRLSQYFGTDPVLQRTDISQAKVIHIANLRSVEGLFARTLWAQIIQLRCSLMGGNACTFVSQNIDPTKDTVRVRAVNEAIVKGREGRGIYYRWAENRNRPTEDSTAHQRLLAKLCVQALAFESREAFSELCRDTEMTSEFAERSEQNNLNISYSTVLNELTTARNSSAPGRIDRARGIGVCALRTYIRKNHVFRMYLDYEEANQSGASR